MINAAKYVEYCGRDGVTKTDLEYGMKYEISEFAKRDNILEDLEEMRREYHAELEREDAEYEDEEQPGWRWLRLPRCKDFCRARSFQPLSTVGSRDDDIRGIRRVEW